jgi:hypothetical protein
MFLTLTPNIPILFTAIPQHFIISPIYCSGFTHVSGEMCCHAVMIHTDKILHLKFLVYKLTWTHENSVFSKDSVNFKHLCSGQSELVAVFMVFNLWMGTGFILSLVVNFLIFNSHFPVTTLGLDLFSCSYLIKILFLWSAVIEYSSIQGFFRVRGFFAWKWNQPSFKTPCFFKNQTLD